MCKFPFCLTSLLARYIFQILFCIRSFCCHSDHIHLILHLHLVTKNDDKSLSFVSLIKPYNHKLLIHIILSVYKDRTCQAGPLYKRKTCGISGRVFDLISPFLPYRLLPVVLDRNPLGDTPFVAGVPQCFVLLLSTQSVIGLVICGNSSSWLLKLNLNY